MVGRLSGVRGLGVLAVLGMVAVAACGDGQAAPPATDVEEIERAEAGDAPAPAPAGLSAREVEEAIAAALAALPAPEAGLPAAEVEEIVAAALAAASAPEPAGLSAREVEEAIAAALAALPAPEAGLSPADVERIARGVVAAVPPRSAPAEYTRFVVDSAIDRYESEGIEATLAHYNDPASVDGQWYVFIVDAADEVIGHYDADRRGLDVKGWVGTDVNGYKFGPEMLAAGPEGRWVTYVYRNPATGDIAAGDFGDLQLKNAWVRRHDGLLFGSGWYVDADAMTRSLVATAVDTFRSVGLAGTVAYFAGAESPAAGLAEAIDYYNSAENITGQWFAFIADADGTIVAHFDPARLGTTLDDLFGAGVIAATADGGWITATGGDGTQTLRVWATEDGGMTFGAGWQRAAPAG